MTRKTRTLAAIGAASLAVAAGVGATSAAAGGFGFGSSGQKGEVAAAAQMLAHHSQEEEAFAKALGKTAAQVEAAEESAADARIDAAKASGEITAEQATELKAWDGKHRLATTADVAKALGVTETKLTEARQSVRKAEMKAHVDEAVKAGRITQSYGDELKKQIDAATFPDGGPGMGDHHGRGGHHGHGPGDMDGMGGPGFGFGFGPGDGQAPPADGTGTGTGSGASFSTITPGDAA